VLSDEERVGAIESGWRDRGSDLSRRERSPSLAPSHAARWVALQGGREGCDHRWSSAAVAVFAGRIDNAETEVGRLRVHRSGELADRQKVRAGFGNERDPTGVERSAVGVVERGEIPERIVAIDASAAADELSRATETSAWSIANLTKILAASSKAGEMRWWRCGCGRTTRQDRCEALRSGPIISRRCEGGSHVSHAASAVPLRSLANSQRNAGRLDGTRVATHGAYGIATRQRRVRDVGRRGWAPLGNRPDACRARRRCRRGEERGG